MHRDAVTRSWMFASVMLLPSYICIMAETDFLRWACVFSFVHNRCGFVYNYDYIRVVIVYGRTRELKLVFFFFFFL